MRGNVLLAGDEVRWCTGLGDLELIHVACAMFRVSRILPAHRATVNSIRCDGGNGPNHTRHNGRRISDAAVCRAAEHVPTYIELDKIER